MANVEEILCGPSGPGSWSAAAAPAAGVPMTGVLNFIYEALAGSAGLASFPSAAIPANDVSLAEVLREIYNQQEKSISTSAAVIASGTATIFTVTGGPIEVLNILSVCVTANDATATTLKWTADPTDGDATDLCAASASLASAVAGTVINITGTVANAAVITVHGTAISQAGRLVVPAGVITTITAVGATTGTWTHHLRYKPLARGAIVT